jgi:two-component system, NarL family, nitrate/nitrite response regulator NarL
VDPHGPIPSIEGTMTTMTTEPTPTIPMRVLFADDHPLFREALRHLLESDPDVRVIGEASDGREAIRMVTDLRPDILLLDLVMPVKGGLETLRDLQQMSVPTRTLLLAAEVGDSDIVEALQLGARGIVMKQTASDLVFKSMRAVMAGQYWVGRECVGELIDKMRERNATPPVETRRATFGLTARELEIVSTVVSGYANGEIAQKYSISIKTVKHHLTNIFDKLGVANRLELALFAVHHRLETAVQQK